MSKRVFFLIVLIATLALPGAALAQGPITPNHSDPTWQASYWNNMTLSGTPVIQRTESDINHDWGTGSPGPSVAADNFSARWTRYLYMDQAGTFRFTATSDDGVRVFIDDVKLIDGWYDHAVKTFTADKALTSGHHLVRVEFYEHMGAAVAKFSWAPVTTNWRGEYYNNRYLTGSPVLIRNDAKIDFNWGIGSPGPGVRADRFSVRWTRTLVLPAGSYRFSMTIDDGGRLWVNNHLLIDQWKDQAATTYTGDIYLPGGGVPVKMEFYENLGAAVARLSWSVVGQPGGVISNPSSPGSAPSGSAPGGTAPSGTVPGGGPGAGAVIVDDKDPGFIKGGSATGWNIAYEGYNGRLYWTKNNDYVRPNYDWVRWYPTLTSRRYEVFVYVPDRYTTTAQARYWVSHADGSTLVAVSQSANGNRWVSLGTYRFRGTSNDYVSLADVTYEPYLSCLIAFDAVAFVPR